MMSFLSVNNLSRSFGGLKAVDDVSFSVRQGLIKAVIGPNGAGKTTLFNCISGASRPDRGAVLFEGVNMFGFPPFRVAQAGIARTFQNLKLCGHMSVLDNVQLGRHRHGRAGLVAGMFRLPAARAEERRNRERALEAMATLAIENLADFDAANLSFGQQRSVELARALATEPRVLLLDEPAAGLTMHETAELAKLILRIRDSGVTILLVEHDMSLVMDISDEVLVLSNGRRIAEGAPREIQRDPEIIRVYLGDDHA
jgi:branched-chain amino acid transport system ATP-binding protein